MSELIEHEHERALRPGAEVLATRAANPLANHPEFWWREPKGYGVVVAGAHGRHGGFTATAG